MEAEGLRESVLASIEGGHQLLNFYHGLGESRAECQTAEDFTYSFYPDNVCRVDKGFHSVQFNNLPAVQATPASRRGRGRAPPTECSELSFSRTC